MTSEANLDLNRRPRLGMVEAVWGEHKQANQIATIVHKLVAAGETALVTRVSPGKAAAVARLLKEAGADRPLVTHHPEARCLTAPNLPPPQPERGQVTVVTGGTSDHVVAREALLALRCHGIAGALVEDVGVAGLHRLLQRLDLLREASVLIVCAGMEGALPTVVAGLLPQPVIGVPVSVGYGVSAGGQAALQGMLASCAPGLTVVNIDNGYGAAMAALRILHARAGREDVKGVAAGDRP
ncbi:MAG: nickel pincer cofactor biosynthesis protein LarB [Cyanobacteriota bacterium]|nr:nickel pincer cofactor biosynthesis protein LarB [Cyanobacteriota bacterium]